MRSLRICNLILLASHCLSHTLSSANQLTHTNTKKMFQRNEKKCRFSAWHALFGSGQIARKNSIFMWICCWPRKFDKRFVYAVRLTRFEWRNNYFFSNFNGHDHKRLVSAIIIRFFNILVSVQFSFLLQHITDGTKFTWFGFFLFFWSKFTSFALLVFRFFLVKIILFSRWSSIWFIILWDQAHTYSVPFVNSACLFFLCPSLSFSQSLSLVWFS